MGRPGDPLTSGDLAHAAALAQEFNRILRLPTLTVPRWILEEVCADMTQVLLSNGTPGMVHHAHAYLQSLYERFPEVRPA